MDNPSFKLHFSFLCLFLFFKYFFGFGFGHLYRFLGSKTTSRVESANKKCILARESNRFTYGVLMQYLVSKFYSYLICFGDYTAFPSRCIFLLVAIWFITLVDVKVAVHLILRVRVISMILVISGFLRATRQTLL